MTVPADPYWLDRARERLASLRALSRPGMCLLDARDVRMALDFKGVSLEDLGLASWGELRDLEKVGALADDNYLVDLLRTLKPGNTGGPAAVDLHNLLVRYGVSLTSLNVTMDELMAWIKADLVARARVDAAQGV